MYQTNRKKGDLQIEKRETNCKGKTTRCAAIIGFTLRTKIISTFYVIINHQCYNEYDVTAYKKKANTNASGIRAKLFTKEGDPELLPEKLPVGPFAGGYPWTVPVEGTTVFGIVAPGPAD